MTDFDKLDALEGLMNPGIGPALYNLAQQVPEDQAIVEVGSFMGKSTCYLACGSRDGYGAPVVAVDPWDSSSVYGKHGYNRPVVRETFEAQLKKMRVRGRVVARQAFSVDAAAAYDGPKIGLLFIDGNHTEPAVRADVEAWSPHLATGHVIAFDDYDTPKNPGVAKVVWSLAGYNVDIVAGHLAVCTAG
jgi:predicted O-methyltransferase YrrM